MVLTLYAFWTRMMTIVALVELPGSRKRRVNLCWGGCYSLPSQDPVRTLTSSARRQKDDDSGCVAGKLAKKATNTVISSTASTGARSPGVVQLPADPRRQLLTLQAGSKSTSLHPACCRPRHPEPGPRGGGQDWLREHNYTLSHTG